MLPPSAKTSAFSQGLTSYMCMGRCHTVKLFHSKNIGFGTIFLHYQYFHIAYKNHDSKIFNILGIQHKNQMKGQEADDTRRREKN